MSRSSTIHRKTHETDVSVSLDIDGSGQAVIQTGIGFFDHMLHHVALHGLFDLNLQASGDLNVDEHHTVEDVGLVLGQAFSEALGDKKGIVRTAHAFVPMDEALAFVALDLSGRPYGVLDVEWQGHAVGGISTTLIEHFFESFAVTCQCNLHARLLYGRDDHHITEALFKALGRALDSATRLDSRRAGIPSTKGTLSK